MSVVTVQLGQCGNQVGQELFDVVCSDAQEGQRKTYSTVSCERFFHQTRHGGKHQAGFKNSVCLHCMWRMYLLRKSRNTLLPLRVILRTLHL